MDRRAFLASAGALVLAACATPPRGTYESTEIPEPILRTGDRWVYRRTDGYNALPRGVLTRSVTERNQPGLRIVTLDENERLLDNALFESPGRQLEGTMSEDGPVTGSMDPAWLKYDFPLVANKRWSQNFYLHRTDLGGNRNYVIVSTQAEGWEDIEVAGKRYRALVLRRYFNLGQKNFWNGTLYRKDLEWYAPAVRGPVRLVTEEEFVWNRSRGLGSLVNGDRFIYQLESFELQAA